tara:strand:+ start:443 stop:670 length:228 start_codon:yes stop_codon:yes gene_type:complete
LHLDGIVFGHFLADINADFARLAPVDGNVGGLILLAVIDTVGFWAVGRAQMAVFCRANIFVNLGDVIHGFSGRKV